VKTRRRISKAESGQGLNPGAENEKGGRVSRVWLKKKEKVIKRWQTGQRGEELFSKGALREY